MRVWTNLANTFPRHAFKKDRITTMFFFFFFCKKDYCNVKNKNDGHVEHEVENWWWMIHELTSGNSLVKIWYLNSAARSNRRCAPLTWQWTCKDISSFTCFHSATTSSRCNLLYHPLNCHNTTSLSMVMVVTVVIMMVYWLFLSEAPILVLCKTITLTIY